MGWPVGGSTTWSTPKALSFLFLTLFKQACLPPCGLELDRREHTLTFASRNWSLSLSKEQSKFPARDWYLSRSRFRKSHWCAYQALVWALDRSAFPISEVLMVLVSTDEIHTKVVKLAKCKDWGKNGGKYIYIIEDSNKFQQRIPTQDHYWCKYFRTQVYREKYEIPQGWVRFEKKK